MAIWKLLRSNVSAIGAAVPLREAVILNVTEGGVKDLLYLPFHIGAKRRSTNAAHF
jgi:hypothetical protein